MRVPRLTGRDDAEAVAFRVLHDDVVGIRWLLVPVHPTGPERFEPAHLGILIIRAQISRVQQCEAVADGLARRVVERRRPERDLAGEVVDADRHRSDGEHQSRLPLRAASARSPRGSRRQS